MIHGYVRVSTEDQARDGRSSLEDQERHIRAIATLRNAEPTLWADRGVSGSIPLRDRPAGRAMLERAEVGDMIVAAKLDRLFRSAKDALNQSEEWQQQGIKLILVDMGLEPVTDSATGQLYFTMLAAFAAFERRRIAERIRDGKTAKRARRGFVGGHAPFGTRVVGDGREAVLETNPEEWEMIRWVRYLAQFIDAREPTRVATILNAKGFRSRANTPITAAQVWRWVRRPVRFDGPEATLECGQFYRCYDALDRLRYIGSSYNARKRFAAGQYNRSRHFTQDWYAAVERIVIENYPTRRAAQAAETEAHRNELIFTELLSEEEQQEDAGRLAPIAALWSTGEE